MENCKRQMKLWMQGYNNKVTCFYLNSCSSRKFGYALTISVAFLWSEWTIGINMPTD